MQLEACQDELWRQRKQFVLTRFTIVRVYPERLTLSIFVRKVVVRVRKYFHLNLRLLGLRGRKSRLKTAQLLLCFRNCLKK